MQLLHLHCWMQAVHLRLHRAINYSSNDVFHQISLSAVSSLKAVAIARTLHVLHACPEPLFCCHDAEPVRIAVSSCGCDHLPYLRLTADYLPSQLTGMQLEPLWPCASCKLVVTLVKSKYLLFAAAGDA